MEKRIQNVRKLILKNKLQKKEGVINFPIFLVTLKTNSKTNFDICVQENEKKISFKSQRKMILMGDLDVCSLFKL